VVPLVEGVEDMQIEYGLDNNGDGSPDVFRANPDTYDSGAGCVGTCNWRKVVAATIYLLVRNFEASPSFTDSKVYTLGFQADGTSPKAVTPGTTYTAGGVAPCAAAATCYPVGYKRHVYQTEVRLNNPSGRNSTP
jgi:type IV pilus assembly protein PilW